MGAKSKIEWTDATWNPIRGCSRVSEGCRNCYAERMAARFSKPGQPYYLFAEMKSSGPSWKADPLLFREHLLDPIRWTKPKKIFVNSMSDTFHEKVERHWIDQIFIVMAHANHHTFQILTKRPKRMLDYINSVSFYHLDKANKHLGLKSIDAPEWPLKNVWVGVSVENQETADQRIPILLETPAIIRFISAEPLLGEIENVYVHPDYDTGLHWVIAGGESGPGARPMHPDWPRDLRDQCEVSRVPFFFKQWGEYVWRETWGDSTGKKHIFEDGVFVNHVGKNNAGRLIDGREWNEFPG